jgi:hypothetical protein
MSEAPDTLGSLNESFWRKLGLPARPPSMPPKAESRQGGRHFRRMREAARPESSLLPLAVRPRPVSIAHGSE